MLTKELLGTDLYHLLAAFAIYSIMGWLVESIYMSFCNRKLTNRGFGKGPFCPIYGFGALFGYFILNPFRGHRLAVYILGAMIATLFEYLVGRGMIRLLGALWWDYHEKPFNYKGIICLDSTVAWGFYALGIVYFLHAAVNDMIDFVDVRWGGFLLAFLFAIVTIDYLIQLMKVFHVDVKQKREQFFAYCISLIGR